MSLPMEFDWNIFTSTCYTATVKKCDLVDRVALEVDFVALFLMVLLDEFFFF